MNDTWVMVDDERNYKVDVICRNVAQAEQYFANSEKLCPCTHLLMDHDLGFCQEKNGVGVLKFILEQCDRRPKFVYLITANPVGRDNMAMLLLDHAYVCINPTLYEYFGDPIEAR